MTSIPAVDGWFTTDAEPRLVASRCTRCGNLVFPPAPGALCRNPACDGGGEGGTEPFALSPRGHVWSYTDAQYQPPPPYVPTSDPFEPFALAAVELPDGLVVLGQVASGYGVADLKVGAEVETVVETLDSDESGERTIWRWRPVGADRGEGR